MFTNTIINALKETYPEAVCALSFEFDWQLLIACRLSAQCTDKRVNEVTPVLFAKFPRLEDVANADVREIEEIIKPCGLFKTKAASIKAACERLISAYGGKVPDSLEELLTLPGVGRKSANLLLGDIYKMPSYVVDTHCIRISRRLRLTKEKLPDKIEEDLRRILPPEESGDFCHRLVLFGREFCTARSPRCSICPVIKAMRQAEPDFECAI